MARKSKGFGELLKQQREETIHQQAMEGLQQKVQRGDFGKQFTSFVKSPEGEVKMSDVLEAFVEPYLDTVRNQSEQEKLLSIAIIAWNLAIMPEQQRQSMIKQLIKQTVGNDRLAAQDMREIIGEMLDRKQRFFADNKRFILDFQLQDIGNSFHLSVVSTLTNPLTENK